MKTLSTLFFILFLSCSSFVFSQNHKSDESTGLPNELDNKYTPDKTSLLNSSTDAYITSYRGSNESNIKNVVSFDITNLARSTVSFYYERAFNKILAAQVGIGATLAKDEVQQTFVPVGLSVFSNGDDNYNSATGGTTETLTNILKQSSYTKTGIFLAAGLKLYVSGTAPKGIFFQVGTTYAVSNLQFTENNGNVLYTTNSSGAPIAGPLTSVPIIVKNLNFNFTWGYQFVVGVGKVKFVNSVYAGIGIKKITYTNVVDYNSNYNSNTGAYSTPYTGVDGTQKTAIMPSLIIGFSIGCGW